MSDAHIHEFIQESQHHNGRPHPSPVTPVNRTRVFLWTLAILFISFVAMAWITTMNRDSLPKGLLVFAIGVAIVPFIASPIEWFVHRYVYHEPFFDVLSRIYSVHTAHHYAYFPTWRYITGGSARRLALGSDTRGTVETFSSNATIRLAHFTWYMTFGFVFVLTPGWFITRDEVFVAGLLAGSLLVSNLFITVHDTIHRPGSHRLIETQPWFGFIDNHHYVHHVDLGCNLNFLLPMADLLFGTLRVHLTDEELRAHGSLKRAKLLRVGEGERASQ